MSQCFEIPRTVRILVKTQILITFATTKHLIISLKAKQLINRVDIDGNRVDFNNRVDQTLFEDQGKQHFLPMKRLKHILNVKTINKVE